MQSQSRPGTHYNGKPTHGKAVHKALVLVYLPVAKVANGPDGQHVDELVEQRLRDEVGEDDAAREGQLGARQATGRAEENEPINAVGKVVRKVGYDRSSERHATTRARRRGGEAARLRVRIMLRGRGRGRG